MLYTWNDYTNNIVNQLYLNFKKKKIVIVSAGIGSE